MTDKEKWERLKGFITEASKGKVGDNGHGIKSTFHQILELMRLIENNDVDDVIVDNLTFRFKGFKDRSIVFGRGDIDFY